MTKRANNPDLPKHPTKNIFISKDYHLPSQNLYRKNLCRIIVKESNDIQTNPTDNLEIYRMTVIDYEHLVGSELFIFLLFIKQCFFAVISNLPKGNFT